MREPGDFEDRLMNARRLDKTDELWVTFEHICRGQWKAGCDDIGEDKYRGYRLSSVVVVAHTKDPEYPEYHFIVAATMTNSPMHPLDGMCASARLYQGLFDTQPRFHTWTEVMAEDLIIQLRGYIDMAYDNPIQLPVIQYSVDRGEIES